MSENFSSVTEVPGNKASQEQLERLYQRYHFARQYCKNKTVLEVACGSGMGLGYLAQDARTVIGGDIDLSLLKHPASYYKKREKILISDFNAHCFPFRDNSFDVVILFEAIYYLEEPETFIQEAHRVLKAEGKLIICSVNKEWEDFNPSPYSHRYYTSSELLSMIDREFSNVKNYGAFPIKAKSLKGRILSAVKRTAITLNLMPKTMKGKEKFKRIFFGKLTALPFEIKEGMTEYFPPEHLTISQSSPQYKVIFSVAEV
jgi:ubiquinone/menaquinone biosynthesis C-methylase UbiE